MGKHGGDRRSEKAKTDQAGNAENVTSLKRSEMNTKAHTLARLDRTARRPTPVQIGTRPRHRHSTVSVRSDPPRFGELLEQRARGEHRRKRPADRDPVGGVALMEPAEAKDEPEQLFADFDRDADLAGADPLPMTPIAKPPLLGLPVCRTVRRTMRTL